jgi:hypothetical protein
MAARQSHGRSSATLGSVLRAAFRAACVVLLLAGVVFFLQGVGVLPGSFMTGRSEWAYIGATLVALAILGTWLSRGRSRSR